MIRATLTDAARALGAVSDTPRLDAELLMAHALETTREALLLGPDRAVPDGFDALLQRRLAHEPIAYITGTRAFWTIELQVGPGALIPRPDSETLIEAAVAHFAGHAAATVLDLGTGPGTLLLAALDQWPHARGLGVDRSQAALAWARRNAPIAGGRATFAQGDWAAAVDGRFDLVLANPPYVGTAEPLPDEVARHEPDSALTAGPEGLDAYRVLVPQLPRLVAPGGLIAVEIGWRQADAVAALFRDAGLAPRIACDLGNRPRAILA